MIVKDKKYVVVDLRNITFLCVGGSLVDTIEEADKFYSKESATEEMDCCDEPENFQVRELTITYEIN